MDNMIFDQKAYSEYMDDMNYSQGFYVTPGRDGSVLAGRIWRVGECSGDHYRKAERAARFAVEEHNKEEGGKEGLLKFLRIVNLNVEPAAAAVYYITMAAADSSGETIHYQAKVWEKINTGYKVQMFRLAPYWLLGVEIINTEQRGVSSCRGVLWFKTCAESEIVVNKYVGKKMPSTNIFYEFDLNICP
ncbi:hypothetical protein Salat_0450600 [Sesamum alatum]|uniref:Cysteine proteinase inhibitor n=1 Tax=Sesamum alatum TaxID=300844 RepID=A0AAE1Z3E2_9LAMI|nr:hypothetical protein Salat_0450600 [Sesamum alatum]